MHMLMFLQSDNHDWLMTVDFIMAIIFKALCIGITHYCSCMYSSAIHDRINQRIEELVQCWHHLYTIV